MNKLLCDIPSYFLLYNIDSDKDLPENCKEQIDFYLFNLLLKAVKNEIQENVLIKEISSKGCCEACSANQLSQVEHSCLGYGRYVFFNEMRLDNVFDFLHSKIHELFIRMARIHEEFIFRSDDRVIPTNSTRALRPITLNDFFEFFFPKNDQLRIFKIRNDERFKEEILDILNNNSENSMFD